LSEPSIEAYRRFDGALQRIMDVLVRRRQLDDTLIVISSDHGQTATHTHVDLDAVVASVYRKTVCYPKIWKHSLAAEAAVMVSGNSMANIYVRGKRDWSERPDFDDPDSQATMLKMRLIEHDAVEHVIHRGRKPGEFVVANREGSLRVEVDVDVDPDVDRDDGHNPFAAKVRLSCHGKNPLGYGDPPGALGRREIAEWSADSAYPDAPWQIVRFFASERAGDLVVCAKDGYDLRARFEYQPHNGSHGGLHRDHMLVPVLANGRWSRSTIRTVDLFPSILVALGKSVPPGIDGEAVEIAFDS
jgi:arylsulfatase A-like enzyme